MISVFQKIEATKSLKKVSLSSHKASHSQFFKLNSSTSKSELSVKNSLLSMLNSATANAALLTVFVSVSRFLLSTPIFLSLAKS